MISHGLNDTIWVSECRCFERYCRYAAGACLDANNLAALPGLRLGTIGLMALQQKSNIHESGALTIYLSGANPVAVVGTFIRSSDLS